MFSTVGNTIIKCGEYHDACGGYLEYRWGCSVLFGDIMIHVGGYHEYCGGCSVHVGYILSYMDTYISSVVLTSKNVITLTMKEKLFFPSTKYQLTNKESRYRLIFR